MPAAEKISEKPVAPQMASTDRVLANVGGVTKTVSPQTIVDAAPRLRASELKIVGSRPATWGASDNYTTVTCATSRTRHKVTRHTTGIQLVYSGLKMMSNFAVPSELPMGGDWEVKAAIHLISSGVTEEAVIPVRFSGRRLALVPNGGLLISDPVSVDLPAGKEFFVYTFGNRLESDAYSEAGGEAGLLSFTNPYWPRESTTRTYDGVAYDVGVGSQFSSSTGIDPFTLDKVDGAYGDLTVNNTLTCGPIAIIGRELGQSGQAPLALVGDSILAGAGDRPRSDIEWSGRGYMDRLLSGAFPAFNASLGGDGAVFKVGAYAFNFATRWRFVEMCDVLYLALGTNDLVSTPPIADIQAALISFATQAKARGIRRVVAATILPRTTSSDGWLTLAGQTPLTTNDFTNRRAQFNAWLLGLPSPIDAIIDLRPAVEDLATGKWKIPPTPYEATTDSGSTSTVVAIASPTLVTSAHIGKQLLIGGEARTIVANSTTSITVVTAFGSAPGAGVSVKIADTLTADGVHPSSWGHKLLGDVVAANAAILGL